MDTARGYDELPDAEANADGVGAPEVKIGGDERRMHVRAYNHWVSLLRDRPYPAIADLDPERIADFGPNSVLLDFTGGLDDPAIQFIGRALRDECGGDQVIARISDVPARSLLSRLTDHYLQIIANRAPIGFEAEFVGIRGHMMLYRGILMPFSSDHETIDYIYGVVNWKELVDSDDGANAGLAPATDSHATTPRHDPIPAPVTAATWADGPGAGSIDPDGNAPTSLDDRLALARESAASARAAATRSHAALYRALGRAHDFALAAAAAPEALEAILHAADIRPQARAPMTAIAKLIFGRDHDKTRLTEAATVLSFAQRTGVPEGGLPRVIDSVPGGIKGIVAHERAARKPATPRTESTPRALIAGRTTLAELAIDSGLDDGAPVILVGRATATGGISVVGTITNDDKLAARVLRRLG